MSGRIKSLKGLLLILASALCCASYGVWSRLLGPHFAVFCQGWVRSVIILLVLLPFTLFGKRLKTIRRGDRGWFAVTMICTVFTQAPLYFAFIHLPLGTATFIFYGFFLITSYGVGWIFLAERVTPGKIASLLLAFIGLLLTFGVSLAVFSGSAMLLAALNGIGSGGEIATSKKSTQNYSSFQITVYSWLLILATHLPISLILGEHQVVPAINLTWVAMLGYAASGLAGFWLVIEGFKYVDASIGGLIGLLEIPMSVVLGVVLFDDHIALPVILGGCVIIASAILPDICALRHRSEKPIPPPPLL